MLTGAPHTLRYGLILGTTNVSTFYLFVGIIYSDDIVTATWIVIYPGRIHIYVIAISLVQDFYYIYNYICGSISYIKGTKKPVIILN
jgi:hypothetical protein